MNNELRSYNIVLTSAKVAFKGGISTDGRPIVWDGSFRYPSRKSEFIGEVFSFYEDHTTDSVLIRRNQLADEHGISPSDVMVVLR